MRNPQKITRSSKRARAPRQQKRSRNFNNKKIEHNGITYDSQTEFLYHQYLLKEPAVKTIEVQPTYQIIEPYKVVCKRCAGTGKLPSKKTGNPINCSLCRGKTKREKGGAIYTADFKVTYIDGYEEVIDVKGGPVTDVFSLRRRLFEAKTGIELIIIRHKNNEWIRE
ncbi:DUF1064 domain-containing protein [Sporosarcina jiandibaonis]|uniref:DUF1064 domain-containing protein n=1 Tax=Sporosarcina jiandibaonis TaxID=2715535 RepID=UPI001552B62F|nr:DUF1064 domain-containing protein [Sporosarcina jiandibaonis]